MQLKLLNKNTATYIVYALLLIFFVQAWLLDALQTQLTSWFGFFSALFILADGISPTGKGSFGRSFGLILRSIVAYPILAVSIANVHFLHMAFYDFEYSPFDDPSPEFDLVLFFYIDNFARGAFMDVMESFDMSISSIELDGDHYGLRGTLLMLRSLPSITISYALVQIVQRLFSKEK